MTKLIIGLGNPGKEYEKTRHNVGFFILDRLAQEWGESFQRQKFQGYYAEHHGAGEKVVLVQPQTYMNLSGECVARWVSFLKISDEDLLVVHDEIDLPMGKFKAQWAAGPAGHNGIRSIIEKLGHKNFNRLRVGVGHPGRRGKVVNHVLTPFRKEEIDQLEEILPIAVEAVQTFVKMGLDPVAQMVNRKDSSSSSEDEEEKS